MITAVFIFPQSKAKSKGNPNKAFWVAKCKVTTDQLIAYSKAEPDFYQYELGRFFSTLQGAQSAAAQMIKNA